MVMRDGDIPGCRQEDIAWIFSAINTLSMRARTVKQQSNNYVECWTYCSFLGVPVGCEDEGQRYVV